MDQEQQAQDEEKHNRHRLENLKRYMNEKLIPAEIQDKVILYQKHKFGRTMGIVDEENVFDGIPRVLRQDIANYLYFDLVSKLPFLKGADRPFLEAVTLAVRPLSVLKGYYIFKKDDEGNEMFFILRGSVDIVNEQGKVLGNLKSGEFFGKKYMC